jgi:glutathione S-transferase
MDNPDFRALNERQKVPFHKDDRVQIGESAATVDYLADRYGKGVLSMPGPGRLERAALMALPQLTVQRPWPLRPQRDM